MPTPLRPTLYSTTHDHRPRLTRVFEAWFLKSWWVILFCLGCYAAFERSSFVFHREYDRLSCRKEQLSQQHAALLDHQDNLLRQINSQSDPAWIELTLIKILGLVPEGQKKVVFQNSTPQQTKG